MTPLLVRNISSRLQYIDVLRGAALVLMVLNHVALYLLDNTLDPWRHRLVYLTVSTSAPLFLLLVGVSLALAYGQRDQSPPGGAVAYYRQQTRRGLLLVLLGVSLNLIISPHEPLYSGGILQTIGISIILFAPLLRHLQSLAVRTAVLIAAAAQYVLFSVFQADVASWSVGHPVLGQMLFAGFPPWPWAGFVLIGLVLGHWVVGLRDDAAREKPAMTNLKWLGLLSVALYFAINGLQGDLVNFNLERDYLINGHWLPSSTTLLWILGVASTGIFLSYQFRASGSWCIRWLSDLGRSALLLYVVHLIAIALIADRALGVRITEWWQCALFSALLLTLLRYISVQTLGVRGGVNAVVTSE